MPDSGHPWHQQNLGEGAPPPNPRPSAPHPPPGTQPGLGSSPDANSRFAHFWTTIPGILTALGTLVAGVAAFVAIFVGKGGEDSPGGGGTTIINERASEEVINNLDEYAEDDIITACEGGDENACARMFDAIYRECSQGYLGSCDVLYWISPVGSEYEYFGATCGNRADATYAGTCMSY